MTLPTDYIDGDVLTAADVNAITLAVNSNTTGKLGVGTFNAKGDLLVGLTNDSVGVLSVGTNGYLLSASSGAASGLAWTAAGGKLLQFAYVYATSGQTTTTDSVIDINDMSISFTPVSASSTIVVEFSCDHEVGRDNGTIVERASIFNIAKDGGALSGTYIFGRDLVATSSVQGSSYHPVYISHAETSGNTTARTYKARVQSVADNLTEITQRLLKVWEIA